MMPGQAHLVMTLEYCLAVGGHFYSSTHFSATLKAITVEHYFGSLITNNDHSHSPVILFKLAAHYLNIIKEKVVVLASESSVSFTLTSDTYFSTEKLPVPTELAALIILIMHMDVLRPDVFSGEAADGEEGDHHLPKETIWQDEDTFVPDFQHAKGVAMELCALAAAHENMVPNFAQEADLVLTAFRALIEKCNQACHESFHVSINADLSKLMRRFQ